MVKTRVKGLAQDKESWCPAFLINTGIEKLCKGEGVKGNYIEGMRSNSQQPVKGRHRNPSGFSKNEGFFMVLQ